MLGDIDQVAVGVAQMDAADAPGFGDGAAGGLGPGQAQFRIGPTERVIDLDGVIAAIAAAVSGFFDIEKQELKSHG